MDMYVPSSFSPAIRGRRLRLPADAAHPPAAGRRPRTALNGFASALPPALAERLDQRLALAHREAWVQRLWARDATLWTGADEDQWLGWLRPGAGPARPARLAAICRRLCVAGHADAVLLGMGGATLGAEALAHILGVAAGGLRLHVLDSTDVAQILALEARLDLTRTLFVVASKSGTTLESGMLAAYFQQRVAALLGRREAGRRFVAITDPGTPLQARALRDGYAAVFEGEPTVGGRNSVLSPFGLVAAALLGHDPAALLRAMQPMLRACSAQVALHRNPGLVLGALLGEAALAGHDKVTLLADPGLRPLGCWLEQLLAESTGKDGKGLIPVADEPRCQPAAYRRDRLFVHLASAQAPDAELAAHASELAAAGHPVLTCTSGAGLAIGQEFFRWQVATAVAAAVLGVNPFDQPDVEASKARTRALAGGGAVAAQADEPLLVEGALAFHGKTVPATATAASAAALLATHAAPARAGGYMALLAYLPRGPACERWLASARDCIGRGTGVATLGGFGPRYLHSCGQLHKGGTACGRFLFITADAPRELAAPGYAAGFGATQAAQAQGDMEELMARGRPCLRVHIQGDLGAGLAQLDKLLRRALAPATLPPPHAPGAGQAEARTCHAQSHTAPMPGAATAIGEIP